MKNSKAISPIFATLILIAIAVIAGVVVYMFTSGTLATMTGSGTAGQEKLAIQSVSGEATTDIVTVYAQSLSGDSVTLDTVILQDIFRSSSRHYSQHNCSYFIINNSFCRFR